MPWRRNSKRFAAEPYYQPVGRELELFAAAGKKLPVMLKGPTGCGKTRFVEHMAWKLGRPLVTVACHDDLTTADLVGRYLIVGDETVWLDGPLTAAVRAGAICYLDEIVEARKDTTVVIHPLTDSRRVLPVEKRGELPRGAADFMLVISYNPGYQSVLKEMKPSTRQRFVALDFDYPPAELEPPSSPAKAASMPARRAAGQARRPDAQAQGARASTKAPAPACWCMPAHLIASGMAPRDRLHRRHRPPAQPTMPIRVSAVDDLIRAVF
jgi:nitric oxide reductase NorQ protein